jgi:hypothetical protein
VTASISPNVCASLACPNSPTGAAFNVIAAPFRHAGASPDCGTPSRLKTGLALVFLQACELGLEGIVSKRAGSQYSSGNSRRWLKSTFARG